MKHILAILALFILTSSAIFAQEGTPAPPDIITGLVTVDTAEVRIGPDFAYDAIGQLPRDGSVTIIGRAGDFFTRWDGRQWLQVEYGGAPAWIYARLLRTSTPFNSIPPRGRLLPRNGDGRVPDGFDLSSDVCSQWVGEYTRSGDFGAGDTVLTVTYPTLTGSNVYSVIVISPTGVRRAFDSTTNTSQIILEDLPYEAGTYTWRVAPYWTASNYRYNWQQVCLLQTGGTFEKQDTNPYKR